MALITVKIFDNTIDAHLLKSKFESEGIVCYLINEHSVTTNNKSHSGGCGIQLKIHDFDFKRAEKIYLELNPSEDNRIASCAKCGSTETTTISPKKSGFKFFVSTFLTLLLAIFTLSSKKKLYCNNCGELLN